MSFKNTRTSEEKNMKRFHASMQYVRVSALNICFLNVIHISQPIKINEMVFTYWKISQTYFVQNISFNINTIQVETL